MATDVHVEVSRGRGFGVTIENHAKCSGTIENDQI
jgi:hypothetical protein